MDKKQHNINPRSLENLRLGAESRRQDKVKRNTTLLPATIEWLEKRGNVSGTIDELVNRAKAGELNQDDTQQEKLNQEIINLKQQLATQADLAKVQPVAINPKAIALLKHALSLKSNAGGAIKAEIREALLLLESSDEQNNF